MTLNDVESGYPVSNGTLCGIGYGWTSMPSIRGVVRPLWRYHWPRNLSQSTGFVARGLLPSVGTGFPRGDRPSPHTKMLGSTAFSAS
ncbi:MAG: hypothetical protein H0X39_03825 [Actinobacteria bacterium]|nr:hypothetical protein [Actinomycetota bacterium]